MQKKNYKEMSIEELKKEFQEKINKMNCKKIIYYLTYIDEYEREE